MPNASRVRQDAEAAARRYAEYGRLIALYNARVDAMNSGNAAAVALYNQQVQEFKDFQKKVESGQEYAVADVGFGNLFGGADPYENAKAEDMIVNGQIQKPFNQEDQKVETAYQKYVTQQQQKLNLEYLQSGGTELDKAPQYVVPETKTRNLGGFEVPRNADSNITVAEVNSTNDPNAPPRPTPTYVAADSEEGKKLLADWTKPVGQFAMIKGQDGKLVAANVDQKGIKDAGFMVDMLPDPMPTTPGGAGVGGFGGTETYWLRNGVNRHPICEKQQWSLAGGDTGDQNSQLGQESASAADRRRSCAGGTKGLESELAGTGRTQESHDQRSRC